MWSLKRRQFPHQDLFQGRQMAGADDVARSHDSDPQFVIVFVH